MYTMTWRVYGRDGHRQRESFYPSTCNDWSAPYCGTRLVEVKCFDRTGTHDYVEVTITRDTKALCNREFDGQLCDGIFENSRIGLVELIKEGRI